MQNPRLASRYAKSLIDLAVEKNSIDQVLADMQLLESICHQSKDFEVMLKSPVIKGDKKLAVILSVVKDNLNPLTKGFITLLVNKGREVNLAEIVTAYIEQYKKLKNIRTVQLTTATVISEQMRGAILNKVSTNLQGQTVELKSKVDESLIGGFVLEVGDKLIDASVKNKLAQFKKRIVDTSYVSSL